MRVSDQELVRAIGTCKREAFRLQTLSAYGVSGEDKDYAAFLAGTPLPQRDGDGWIASIAAAVGADVKRTNVHVLPRVLTPYLRYGIDWWYIYRSDAGERILFVLDVNPTAAILRRIGDFWLLDRSRVIRMCYDPAGKYLGAELETDPAVVQKCIEARDLAVSAAVTLQQVLHDRRIGSLT